MYQTLSSLVTPHFVERLMRWPLSIRRPKNPYWQRLWEISSRTRSNVVAPNWRCSSLVVNTMLLIQTKCVLTKLRKLVFSQRFQRVSRRLRICAWPLCVEFKVPLNVAEPLLFIGVNFVLITHAEVESYVDCNSLTSLDPTSFQIRLIHSQPSTPPIKIRTLNSVIFQHLIHS